MLRKKAQGSILEERERNNKIALYYGRKRSQQANRRSEASMAGDTANTPGSKQSNMDIEPALQ